MKKRTFDIKIHFIIIYINYKMSYKRKLEIYNNDNNEYSNKKIVQEPYIYTIGNEIHYTSVVNPESIEYVIMEMTRIITNFYKKNTIDKELTITYIVCSPGGCLTSIFKFVDFINLCRSKYPKLSFESIITGHAASAGTIMAIIADKRYMTKYAYAMVHELSSGSRGTYTHLQTYSEHLKSSHNQILEIYMQHQNKKNSRKKLEEIMKNETWMTSEEYLKLGFVDEIK